MTLIEAILKANEINQKERQGGTDTLIRPCQWADSGEALYVEETDLVFHQAPGKPCLGIFTIEIRHLMATWELVSTGKVRAEREEGRCPMWGKGSVR